MKSESIAYVIAGMCFGIILGWVIGTQQARRPGRGAGADRCGASRPPARRPSGRRRALDEGRVQALNDDPQERPEERWTPTCSSATSTSMPSAGTTRSSGTRRRSSSIRRTRTRAPTWASATTTRNSPTRRSHSSSSRSTISPKHTKTLLNKGIVLAFGKQDLKAAATEWQKVVDAGARQPGGAGGASRARRASRRLTPKPGATPSNQ